MSLARDIADLGAVTSRLDTVGAASGSFGIGRNVIYNGAMNLAQRGTSSTGIGASAGYFTCDRWYINSANTAGRLTMSQDSDGPSGFANCIKLDCTTADTSIASNESLRLIQKFEGQDLQRFAKGTSAAKEFAVSFYVKANAAFTFGCELFDNDNSRQISKTFSTTTDWVRHEITFPADTTGAFADDNALSLQLQFWLHAGSNFTSGTLNSTSWASNTDANRAVGIGSFFSNTSNDFYITGVQLEETSVTDFEHRSFGDELQACKRYFEHKTFNTFIGIGYANIGANAHVIFPYLEKRAAPTVTLPTAGQGSNEISFLKSNGSYPSTTGSNTVFNATKNQARIQGGSYSGLTVEGPSALFVNGEASVTIDAEL